jgi:hypothetical protein
LCLDLLNRSEDEPEFAESQRLVEQAISTIKGFDGSILASRGVQLLSSLLTGGRAKQSSTLQTQGPGLGIRPLENTLGIDSRWIRRQFEDDAVPADSTSFPAHRLPCGTVIAPNAADTNVPDALSQPGDQYQFLASSVNDFRNLAPDMAFFDLFSEYYPTLSGIDNASLIEDMFR